MRKHYVFILFIIGLATQSSAQVKQEEKENNQRAEIYTVSMIQLISTPEKYHEKEILVTGFLNLKFEGCAIYLHQEDYKYSIYKNGIWVDFFNCTIKEELSKANQKYVMIRGVFDMNLAGHFGLWSGTIKDIISVTPIKSRE